MEVQRELNYRLNWALFSGISVKCVVKRCGWIEIWLFQICWRGSSQKSLPSWQVQFLRVFTGMLSPVITSDIRLTSILRGSSLASRNCWYGWRPSEFWSGAIVLERFPSSDWSRSKGTEQQFSTQWNFEINGTLLNYRTDRFGVVMGGDW